MRGQRLVERGLADLQPRSGLANVQPLTHERLSSRELFGRNGRFAPAFAASRCRSLKPGARALADEVALELAKRTEHVEDEPAARRGGVDAFG